jgi:hypothetical protein
VNIEENGESREVFYDVKYVLGGSEKAVASQFVSLEQQTSSITTASSSAAPLSATEEKKSRSRAKEVSTIPTKREIASASSARSLSPSSYTPSAPSSSTTKVSAEKKSIEKAAPPPTEMGESHGVDQDTFCATVSGMFGAGIDSVDVQILQAAFPLLSQKEFNRMLLVLQDDNRVIIDGNNVYRV